MKEIDLLKELIALKRELQSSHEKLEKFDDMTLELKTSHAKETLLAAEIENLRKFCQESQANAMWHQQQLHIKNGEIETFFRLKSEYEFRIGNMTQQISEMLGKEKAAESEHFQIVSKLESRLSEASLELSKANDDIQIFKRDQLKQEREAAASIQRLQQMVAEKEAENRLVSDRLEQIRADLSASENETSQIAEREKLTQALSDQRQSQSETQEKVIQELNDKLQQSQETCKVFLLNMKLEIENFLRLN